MASDEDNCDYLNGENVEVEYEEDNQDLKHILDIPVVEIDIADEPNYDNDVKNFRLEVSEEHAIMTNSKESEDGWDEDKVKMLLETYLQNADKFRNPKIKKKLLWRKVGDVIGKDADACDKKFRNLKQHYITVSGKKRRFGSSVVRWPFFNLFEQIHKQVGFNFSERLRYRPILKKPDWSTPQILMLGNSPTLKTPIIVNSVAPVNSSLSIVDDGFVSNADPQKKRKREEFDNVKMEIETSQINIEQKLDRLVQAVEESNNIQRERNKLFQEYLRKIK